MRAATWPARSARPWRLTRGSATTPSAGPPPACADLLPALYDALCDQATDVTNLDVVRVLTATLAQQALVGADICPDTPGGDDCLSYLVDAVEQMIAWRSPRPSP